MVEGKDNAIQLESSQDRNALDHIEAKGYADAAIQKQNHQILDGTAEAQRIERRYMRRLNVLILPTISALYFFEYLDRGNVAVSSAITAFEGTC